MRQPSKAQVSVEYMAIVTLIMIGVLAGGPTLIRSINAYFQNLNQGVADSLRERINEVPVYPMPPCVCTDVTGNCGSIKKACDGKRECCEYEREWDAINCAPPSCNLVDRRHCRFDDSCCTETKLQCGINSNSGAGVKNPATNFIGNSCADGYRMWYRECGAAKKEYHCDRDASCDFVCSAPKDVNSLWCPGYNTRLPSDLTTYMVTNCGDRNANGKCEATCVTGYNPDPMGGACVDACGNGVCDPWEDCDKCCVDCVALKCPPIDGWTCGTGAWFTDLGPAIPGVYFQTPCSNCPGGMCWKAFDWDGDFVVGCNIPPGYSQATSCVLGKKGWAHGVGVYCYGSHVGDFYFHIRAKCATSCP